MKSLKRSVYYLSFVLLLAPSYVLAQLSAPRNEFGLPGDTGSTITGEVGIYVNLFLGLVGLIAVVFLVYGGFRYITSGGNEESAEAAKKIITNSIIGLIVIIMSYIIVTVIINAFFGRT